MPEIEAPEIEIDEDAPQFRRRLAIVVVLITLFGACVAYLHEQNSNFEDNAAREAQISSIRGFGQQVDSLTAFGFDYSVFVEKQLLQREVVVSSARQRSTVNAGLAQLYNDDNARFTQLTNAVGTETRVEDQPGATKLQSQLDVTPDKERLRQQVFANKANDYGNKADSYVALLTVLAVSLFLIGLSLTVGGRGRYLLAIPGVAIAIVCVLWSVLITTGSITKVSDNAVNLTADGQQLVASGDAAGGIQKLKAAVADSSGFGEAWARLADAEFINGAAATGTSFQSISDPEATKRAVADGEKAISLGVSNPSELSSIGFYHFTIGEFARAEDLSEQALQGNDQFPPLVFNLGVVQVARGETTAARSTYERAIQLLSDRRFDVLRSQIIEAARTDLEIAVDQAPSSKDLASEMNGMLSQSEEPDHAAGTTVPEHAPSGSSVDNVKVTTDRFRLTASYSANGYDSDVPLLNVWYFRPLDKNGKGPFQQVSSMDTGSFTGTNPVTTIPVEPGACLPGGDYRVDVYAGADLVASATEHIGDSSLGTLEPQGGDQIGFTMCVPSTWKATTVQGQPDSLAFQNPDDPTQAVFVRTFPIGSGSGANANAVLTATIQTAITAQNITPGPVTTGNEFLGRTIDGADVLLDTTSVSGTDPNGVAVRITGSVGSDNVVRLIVVTAANPNDLDVVRSELVNSLRFLRAPAPPTSQPSGG